MRFFLTRARTTDRDSEAGNAIVEFIGLAALLMVPTVYSLLAIAHVQAGAYASVAAAQQALQVLEAGDRGNVSAAAAQRAAQFAVRDYGFPEENVSATLSCTGNCIEQPVIRVTVRLSVDAPYFGWVSERGVITMTTDLASWGGRYE